MSLAWKNFSVFLQPVLVFISPAVATDSVVKAGILKLVYLGSDPGSANDLCGH